ncbi:MAG TPA: hypothetical protein VMT16_14570 [Thermoanaerobaculia bacterium]|nr:hypothetical protein [Thermoanaerobaculia bacterium]
MVSIPSLWAPIVLSAVLVFVVSSIVHMALAYHRSDYRPLPREGEALDMLRGLGLAPGLYTFPHCESPKEMGTPEMLAKYERGPVGLLTVLPSRPPAMGKHLAAWFVYCLVIGVFVAYLAGRTLAPGTEYLEVFRVAGTAALMAYGLGYLVLPIWWGQPWATTLKHVFDGLLYALVTAGAFAWLWPA